MDSPALQEESDIGANSSGSEYLLSDPTGYKSQIPEELSPDKKVQFHDSNVVSHEKEKPHKEKKKKKWVYENNNT